MRPALTALALLTGCATVQAPAAPGTLYRRNDFVDYRYTGSALGAPVELRERIARQDGNRLEIEVVARRAGEERHWVQVVTDTPENQRENRIDALYEIDPSGARKQLANVNNADLLRLYAWTLIFPDGRARNVTTEPTRLAIGAETYDCQRRRGENTLKGRPIKFEDVTCPKFLWTHALSRFVDAQTGEELLRVEVAATGRE